MSTVQTTVEPKWELHGSLWVQVLKRHDGWTRETTVSKPIRSLPVEKLPAP